MGICQALADNLAQRRPVRSTRHPAPSYVELSSSDSSDDFEDVNSTFDNSLLENPPRPPISPSSNQYLLQPTQPETDEVLNQVANSLQVLESINTAASDLPKFPSPSRGQVRQADSGRQSPQIPAIMVNYDVEDKEDGEDYYKRVGMIKLAWDPDVHYWFNSIEASLRQAQVFSQWTKREILQTLLPDEVREEVRYLLRLPRDKAGITPYKDIKDALIEIFAPKPEDSIDKALKLVLTSRPSLLGKQLIEVVCKCHLR